MPVDIEAVATATTSCPSVERLSSGALSEIATYLPGRRVIGVRARDEELEVHVVGKWPVPLPLVADEVRAAVTPLSEGLPVGIYIDDIDVPPSVLGVEDPPPPELPPAMDAPAAPGQGLGHAGLPGENLTPGVAPGEIAPGEVLAPGDPVESVTVLPGDTSGVVAPGDPLLEDATLLEPTDGAIESPPGPPATGGPPGSLLPEGTSPKEGATDELVVEDEVAGDVIPGEPLTSRKKSRSRRQPKKGTPGDLG